MQALQAETRVVEEGNLARRHINVLENILCALFIIAVIHALENEFCNAIFVCLRHILIPQLLSELIRRRVELKIQRRALCAHVSTRQSRFANSLTPNQQYLKQAN